MITTMTTDYRTRLLALSIAGALSGALLFGATIASAGECPADKVTENGQKPGATAHKGVAEKLLGQIDLAKEKVAIGGITSACAVSTYSPAARSPGIATRIVRR